MVTLMEWSRVETLGCEILCPLKNALHYFHLLEVEMYCTSSTGLSEAGFRLQEEKVLREGIAYCTYRYKCSFCTLRLDE